jgi:hypothetical protein
MNSSMAIAAFNGRLTTESAIHDLEDLLASVDKKNNHRIKKTMEHLEKSLKDEYWKTDSTLTRKGKKIFEEDRKAVKELKKLIKDKKTQDSVKEVCETVIDELVTTDKALAETALNVAKAYQGTDKKVDKEIKKSEKEMDKAQKELSNTKRDSTPDPRYDKAIDHYKKAWEHAQKAMKKLPELIDEAAVLIQTANSLRAGDIQSAAENFTPSSKDDILLNSNTEEQNQLAEWIENAELIFEKENYKVYRTEWVDEDGETNIVEFIMSPDEAGKWKIISW